jgi:hypothetical protein
VQKRKTPELIRRFHEILTGTEYSTSMRIVKVDYPKCGELDRAWHFGVWRVAADFGSQDIVPKIGTC